MNLTRLVILALIESPEQTFLVSVRHDPIVPEAHMKYDLIGGTNEFGEHPEDTVRREVFEEVGIHLLDLQLLPIVTQKKWQRTDSEMHTVVLCYHGKVNSTDCLVQDGKITSLRWITRDELQTLDFLPTVEPFIAYFLREDGDLKVTAQ